MNRICQDKFALRHEVVRYAETHGVRAAARHYESSRTTVHLWFRRWKAGDDALADHSRRPHHSPQRTDNAIAAEVIAARKKAPCFGARRLVDMFELPVGKGAAHRILRDEKLIRPRPRKPWRKADLRALKAAHPPLLRLQMDTKYRNDIPHYFPQMQRPGMPRFQYTIRGEALGALFLAYSCELSKTYATLAATRVTAHGEERERCPLGHIAAEPLERAVIGFIRPAGAAIATTDAIPTDSAGEADWRSNRAADIAALDVRLAKNPGPLRRGAGLKDDVRTRFLIWKPDCVPTPRAGRLARERFGVVPGRGL